ncbi:MAG: hypothetical protein M1824_002887 [Vezdaea acicularis]|nr:MAG: hypothetical protein M1824_002887 [Vezdaea acicularis]
MCAMQEKRYRSMQEHIRRAHPEHYISKLPATEESFFLMVNSTPSVRPPQPPVQSGPQQMYGHDRPTYYGDNSSSPATPRHSDEYHPHSLLPAATAAAALASLYNHNRESDWESEAEAYSDTEAHHRRIASSIELPPLRNHLNEGHGFPGQSFDPTRPRQLLPSIMSRSPPGRSSTLPPIQRRDKQNRPRKPSISQNARKPKHEKKTSKDHIRRISHDRKAYSAEPTSGASALGKRWEDLIDAAASATEEPTTDEDRTPVPPSPPLNPHRASLPPLASTTLFQSYQASPLQNALTPPSYDTGPEPFPSVESGENFHIDTHGLDDSSPTNTTSSQNVQIYCAACRRTSLLRNSYACTECICGVCRDCVEVLTAVAIVGRSRPCPKCGTVGGKWRPFQLDIR